MSEEKDDLVQHEPIATGPVRMQLYGDEKLAHSHLLEARKQLGQLKSSYGVNERVAAGEPGGYFRSSRVLADGTRIEAFTNDGLDSVRITAPVQRPTHTDSSDAQGESHSYTPTPVDASYTPEWPKPEKEESEKPLLDFTPYLWIGVRIVKGSQPLESDEVKYPQKWAQRLHVCVWEPTPPGQDPVILSNRNDFEPLIVRPPQHLEPEDVYPLKHWTQFIPSDFEDPRDTELQNQDFDNPLPTAIAYTDAKLVMIQPANVYDIEMRVPNYDPQHDEDVEWDIMFISDPDNDLQLVDKADETLTMQADYSGGEYQIKVMCVGPDCHVLEPVEVEIMIIIGKDDEEERAKHRFTIEQHTNYRMGIMPMGWFKEKQEEPAHPCDACLYRAQDYGPNPHGRHWWQGMAVALVPHLQVAVPEEVYLPPIISFSREGEVEIPDTGFERAAFHERPALCPGCVIRSTRYFQDTFTTGRIGYSFVRNDACDANTTVLGPYVDSPHFAIAYKPRVETSYVSSQHPWGQYNQMSAQWESDTGDSLTTGISFDPTEIPFDFDEYEFEWTTGAGGRCIGKDHDEDPDGKGTAYTRLGDMLFHDFYAFQAEIDHLLGGPPSDTVFHASWTITKQFDVEGNLIHDDFRWIPLSEYVNGPFQVHNNPDVKGEDVCATGERWTWSVFDYDNLPPNHQK